MQPDLVQKLPDAAALDSLNIHTLLLHPEVPYTTASQRPAPDASAAAAGGFAPLIPTSLPPAGFGAAAAASTAWERGQLGTPDTTCYIIYTSGSTGKPKGVVVIHQGLTAYVAWFKTFFGITSTDVFMQKTPTNFDASIDELWTSLSAGCRLVVAAPEAHRDVHSVMMLIARCGLGHTQGTSLLAWLLTCLVACLLTEGVAAHVAPSAFSSGSGNSFCQPPDARFFLGPQLTPRPGFLSRVAAGTL